MHIAVKQIISILVLVIAAASPCVHAADDEPVLVRSSSIENGVVLLQAEVEGKETEFTCSTNTSKCSAVSPGEYAMETAGSAEQSYNDCTNVVLYRASSRSGVNKEKVGVYCWSNDDCYIADCVSVHVQTVPSNVPDTIVEQATNEICKEQGRPDCQQAVAFFDRLPKAISTNDRGEVASMAHFPLRVTLNGKKTLVTNKSDLFRHYDAVFDYSVRCVLAHARRSDVWGNWQGFTVGGGVAWWERSSSLESSFKLITINNDSFYKGCGEPKH
jgi:hypothetical protein